MKSNTHNTGYDPQMDTFHLSACPLFLTRDGFAIERSPKQHYAKENELFFDTCVSYDKSIFCLVLLCEHTGHHIGELLAV